MSSEIQFRQHLRKRKKKQKSKKNFLLIVLSLVIITVFAFAVKTIFTKISEKKNSEPDFIFNGYIYPEPPPKSADILADIPDNNGEKTAYLTFDDGPNNSVTPQVLDILRRYNIKATFFMVGSMIEKNPDMARRVFEEGHLAAGHSYSHQYSKLYADTQSFMNEVNKTHELIQNITGRNDYPKIFRFPGGGFNAGVYGEIKQECKLLLEKEKFLLQTRILAIQLMYVKSSKVHDLHLLSHGMQQSVAHEKRSRINT